MIRMQTLITVFSIDIQFKNKNVQVTNIQKYINIAMFRFEHFQHIKNLYNNIDIS